MFSKSVRQLPPLRRCRLVLLIAAVFHPAYAAAQATLSDVVVTATRIETEADKLPSTVTSVDRKTLDRRLARDEADLFRDEPDVAMARDLRRFGATRINIRGIEDNRVIQTVDGVRLPDFYNGGGPTNFTLSATPGSMPDFLKRVEIVRGAASSLYGSDAIGGVVGFVTLAPADLLAADRTSAYRVKASYLGANRGYGQTVLAAARAGSMEMLLGISQVRASETANMGETGGATPARSLPNPQDAQDRGVLAKFTLRPAPGHRFGATIEGREQHADTQILRMAASMPKVSFMQGDDNARRVRGSLEWEHRPANGWYDRLTTKLFVQDAHTQNKNAARRSNTSASCSAVAGAGNQCSIDQEFIFDQRTRGAGLLLEKGWEQGSAVHMLTAGIDLGRAGVEERRDARIRNETTGTGLAGLAGEVYPLRDFANGVTDTTGIFVQDEIGALADGRLNISLGLRFDHTRLKPEVDALAQQALSQLGRQVSEQTHSAVSPKLGAQWKLTQEWTAYGQIAGGFRAPNYAEVNGAFRNASQFYSVVPNPDLKPETSTGLELGLRLHAGAVRSQLALFDNRYRDFIETIQLACPADPRCYKPSPAWRTNTSINLNQVRIYGVEARGSWDFAPGWRSDAAVAYNHGDNEQTDQPLNSVEPTRLSAGILRDGGDWGAEARVRAALRKSRIDASGSAYFQPPGYAVLDVGAWWTVFGHARLNLAVNNLLDRRYWLWSDIRQADAPNPAGVAFYSQPGRKLSVSVQVDF